MLAEQRAERARGARLGHVRLVEVAADVEAHRRDRQAEEEGQAPAPALERVRRQCAVQDGRRQRAQQRGDALAAELPADAETAALHAAGLHQHGGGGADLAAQREALQQASGDDHQRAEQAGRGIGRRQRQAQRAGHHQTDGERHGGLAPVAVGVVADHEAAQRAHHEADAEGGHGQQQGTIGAVGGKNSLPIRMAKSCRR